MWQWEFQKSTEKKLESSLNFHPNRILHINDETQENQTKYWYLYKDQIQIIKTMKPFCMEESIPSRNWKMVIVWTRTSKCSWSLQLFVLICSAAPRNSQSHLTRDRLDQISYDWISPAVTKFCTKQDFCTFRSLFCDSFNCFLWICPYRFVRSELRGKCVPKKSRFYKSRGTYS